MPNVYRQGNSNLFIHLPSFLPVSHRSKHTMLFIYRKNIEMEKKERNEIKIKYVCT